MLDLPRDPTRFDGLVIDWGRLLVQRDDTTVKLTPKAAAVLQLLIAQAGATVTRREILDRVWPGTFSSDEVLTQVIAELRRALGDPARDARWIATVPKLGYRWIGPVESSAPPPPAAPAPDSPMVPAATQPPATPRRLPGVVALVLAAAALVAGYRASRAPSGGVLVPVPAPVTNEAGRNLDPALAPDGRRVAYVHVLDDRAHLRVRTFGEAAFEDVALGDDGRPAAPAWSPDGRELAYVWHTADACEIRRVALATGAVATVAPGCPTSLDTSLDWSPDGTFIAFSRSFDTGATLAARTVAIHRVAPDGSALARVSNAHRWLVVDGHPRISPDSREIAFVRDGDGRNRIVRIAADGTGEERVVPFERWPYRVAWRGTGFVVAAHGSTPAEIWRIRGDGASAAPVAAQSGGPGLAVSRDGAVLVFEQRRVDDNVWRIPLDRAGAAPVQATREARSELCPRIAPDGTTLAYLADDAGPLEVVLLELGTGVRRRITRFAPRAPVDLRWAPSARWLAVVVGDASGKHLAIVDVDGAELPIPPAVAAWRVTQAEWTHDEAHLLVGVENGGRRELHRLRFPALDGDELVTDHSIGAFASMPDEPAIFVTRARRDVLERFDAAFVATDVAGVTLRARPGDQWALRGGMLVQQAQVGRGSTAMLRWGPIATQDGASELRIRAPEPPLGRNVDVGGGALWYASRDLDHVDLVRVGLAPD